MYKIFSLQSVIRDWAMGLDSSLFTSATTSERRFFNITTAYFAAGAFDYFGIESIIDEANEKST